MAAITRQPFAPLDESRLQTLTSLKNRQNAIQTPVSKRKAESIYMDDAENVDPILSVKRSKGASGKGSILKPTTNLTLKSTTTPKPVLSTVPTSVSNRRTITPKPPSARLNTNVVKPSPLSAPAGRSPTRGIKRAGLLGNSRRRMGRIDPPSFNLGGRGGAPFSLDAALKGTIPSYAPAAPKAAPKPAPQEPGMQASWFFDIHEDTAEQEMTNLLQHGTCVLDISSDEESARRANCQGREDKENVAPVDDVSQTTSRRSRRAVRDDEMIVEKERVALGEMDASEFFAEGLDEASVIIVPADEEAETDVEDNTRDKMPVPKAVVEKFEFAPELKHPVKEATPEPAATDSFEAMISQSDDASPSKAAVLLPIEGTGESFELWESDSTKDEGEATASS